MSTIETGGKIELKSALRISIVFELQKGKMVKMNEKINRWQNDCETTTLSSVKTRYPHFEKAIFDLTKSLSKSHSI